MKKPEPLFYIPVPDNDHDVAGPYDLVQMARLLRQKVVNSETMVYREGETDWRPFGELPQYVIAMEIPLNADSLKVIAAEEKQQAGRAPIPLPSGAMLAGLGGALIAVLVGAVGVFFLARADETTGLLLAIGSGALALVGWAFILVKLFDEPMLTRLLVFFLPLFDIYYFTANLEKYLPYFCMKYIGTIFALAAFFGINSVDEQSANELSEMLSLFRL